MIIAAIIALSFVVLAVLIEHILAMPSADMSFITAISMYLPYITRGMKMVNAFTHAEIVLPLALACLGFHTAWEGYRIVMWVMKKIPMFGVSD